MRRTIVVIKLHIIHRRKRRLHAKIVSLASWVGDGRSKGNVGYIWFAVLVDNED